jgi:lysophospholipase L1-like esterase
VKKVSIALVAMCLAIPALAAAPVASAAATAAPAAAAPGDAYYLSLGDSLAASYQPVGRWTHGYVDQLLRRLRHETPELQPRKLGCPGETAASMRDGSSSPCSYPQGSQLDQALAFLGRHADRTALITIDIGANDVVEGCLDDATALIDEACAEDVLVTVRADLTAILGALRTAAPDVPIVGMTYYDPFLGFWILGPRGRHVARADQAIFELMNARLQEAFDGAGVPVADVAGAFEISNFEDRVRLPGFGRVPVNVARACTWTWMCAAPPAGPDIHANTAGYRVIARAFVQAIPA